MYIILFLHWYTMYGSRTANKRLQVDVVEIEVRM